MPRYDVFIAYGGLSESHARELYEALAESLGKDRVFFDKELSPGAGRRRSSRAYESCLPRGSRSRCARAPDGSC